MISRRSFLRASGPVVLVFVTKALPAYGTTAARSSPGEVQVDDPAGLFAELQAPVCVSARFSDALRQAAAEGRLQLREKSGNADQELEIPAQLLPAHGSEELRLCWLMPPGRGGRRTFRLESIAKPSGGMVAAKHEGQFVISERSTPVLRYNYATVLPGELLNSVSAGNRKYAVARSDYIHPLYGPSGEELTKDWSVDHPHHRGIYWAWPEVDWQGRRGDLHALQKVFARPRGGCETVSGPVFAQLEAHNVWLWEDRDPIVRERATIRAYAGNVRGRIVDLEFHFQAVDSPVAVARRDTTHYGGLNIRLNAVSGQKITKSSSPAGVRSPGTWADLSGTFAGAASPAGLTILQIASNPEYPGDWVEYPELNWLQPTFPASGTRYAITREQPLVLRFRLWVHRGATPPEETGCGHWQAANSTYSPLA